MKGFRFSRAVAIAVLLLPAAAPAATHTWKGGGGDNYWSNVDNWTGGAPEMNEPGGTVLMFPASAQSYVTVCDESHYYVQQMIFRGSWSNFATGVPDAAGILKLDQSPGLNASRLFFRLVQP